MTDPHRSPTDLDDRGNRPSSTVQPPSSASPDRPTRRRTALWAATAAIVLGALVLVFAAAKPADRGSASSPLIGKPAPPIAGPSLFDGPPSSLSSYTGRWVLVNFAASWCVPCRSETPQLSRFVYEHSAAGDATVMEVEYDPPDKGNLRAFLLAQHATWPAVDDSPAVVAYGVGGIPESFLVDPAGTVVAKFIGGISATEIDTTISRLTPGRQPVQSP